MATNIVSRIGDYFAVHLISKVASYFSLRRSATQRALSAWVPPLLAGLVGPSWKPEGCEAFVPNADRTAIQPVLERDFSTVMARPGIAAVLGPEIDSLRTKLNAFSRG